jgi:hypothetical protein
VKGALDRVEPLYRPAFLSTLSHAAVR